MITYRYGKVTSGEVIDIERIGKSEQKSLGPYSCLGCNGELIANIGKIKAKYFSHKSLRECSKETYLHNLGKLAVYKKYEQCLATESPFNFTIMQTAECINSKDKVDKCSETSEETYDLTKHFKKAFLEKKHNGFIPDILLLSDDGNNAVYIEIAVTHKCEEEKINSGTRIIEIEILEENDITNILYSELISTNENIRFYNFIERKPKNLCTNGICNYEKVIEYETYDIHYIQDACWKCKKSNKQVFGFSTDVYGDFAKTVPNASTILEKISNLISNKELRQLGLNVIGKFENIKGNGRGFPYCNACLYCGAPQNNYYLMQKLNASVKDESIVKGSIPFIKRKNQNIYIAYEGSAKKMSKATALVRCPKCGTDIITASNSQVNLLCPNNNCRHRFLFHT